MRRLCYILLMISSLLHARNAHCQEVRDSVRIYFRQGSSALDFSIGNNEAELNRIADRLSVYQADSTYRLKNITVIGGASPESSIQLNNRLSESRAKTLYDYMSAYGASSADTTDLVYLGRDWHGLLKLVKADDKVPYKDEVIALIHDIILKQNDPAHLSQDGYSRLVNLRKGDPHWYLYRKLFPELRATTWICVWRKLPEYLEPLPVLVGRIDSKTSTLNEFSFLSSYSQDETVHVSRITVAAARTNLLIPGFNFGVEVPIGNRWSVGADYYYPWLSRRADHKDCFQLLGLGFEGRYWFGKNRTASDRLRGHSIGLSAYSGYYDVERSFVGHQGEFAAVCLDYLYAMPIFNDKVNLEFNIGAGYLYSYARPYEVFEPGGKAFKEGFIKNVHWFGPLKAGVSLVVPIRVKGGGAGK